MIAVIADDFTGAAELAGIGLRYNLKVELALPGVASSGADVFVVSTDSRSLNRINAQKITTDTLKGVLLLKPGFIYKKIDSVFRGHVLDEVRIQMEESGLKKALILGANPSLNRTIKDGKYFINGEPISETDFATDPEFAISESSVLKMMKARPGEVAVLKHTDPLPLAGIIIGEAVFGEDITAWANKIDNSWLLAGAGDFFTALLDKEYKARPQEAVTMESPHLYVSGTAFGKSRDLIKRIKRELNCVAYIPAAMMETGKTHDEAWYNLVIEMLDKQKKVVIAIDDDLVNPWNVSPLHLRITMAMAVKKILQKGNIKELFIEGGSTAAAILKELEINKLSLVNELQRGVVRMKAKDLYITVKPGSYDLPKQIEKLYTHIP